MRVAARSAVRRVGGIQSGSAALEWANVKIYGEESLRRRK